MLSVGKVLSADYPRALEIPRGYYRHRYLVVTPGRYGTNVNVEYPYTLFLPTSAYAFALVGH